LQGTSLNLYHDFEKPLLFFPTGQEDEDRSRSDLGRSVDVPDQVVHQLQVRGGCFNRSQLSEIGKNQTT
jgi:hypothetical protein